MRITTVTVHASTGFNHPRENYANFKPGITLVAELEPGEDSAATFAFLQKEAHAAVMGEKARILHVCEKEADRLDALSRYRTAKERWESYLSLGADYRDSLEWARSEWQAAHAVVPNEIPAPPEMPAEPVPSVETNATDAQ